MPKGKKICPECQAECGARSRNCKCGYAFAVKSKQERPPSPSKRSKTNQKEHPLAQTYGLVPGLWVFDLPKGMPPIHAPGTMPSGPLTNEDVHEFINYNGLGDCIYDYIPVRKIADPKLRKKWERAKNLMQEIVEYIDENR